MRQRIAIGLQVCAAVVLVGLIADILGWLPTADSQHGTAGQEEAKQVVLANSLAYVPSWENGPAYGPLRQAVEQWRTRGLTIAKNTESLYSFAEDTKLGSVIYLDEKALRLLDDSWLNTKFQKGVAFVGLGVSVSDLCGYLGAVPTLANLDMSKANGRIQVSLCHEFRDERGSGAVFYADFWSDLSLLPYVIVSMVAPSLQ
jgi:hypothetical protein